MFDERVILYLFKQRAWVGLPSDFVVYCYLANRLKFNNRPNNRQIAWTTGLTEKTVASVLVRLANLGLYVGGEVVPDDTLFYLRKTGEHWSERYQFWKCLVRAPQSPLTLIDTLFFSFMLNSFLSGFVPPQGFSESYVAKVLGVDRGSIADSITRLEKPEINLFRRKDWSVATCLVGQQQEYFLRKPTKSKSGKQKIGGFVPNPQLLSDVDIPNIGEPSVLDLDEGTFEPKKVVKKDSIDKPTLDKMYHYLEPHFSKDERTNMLLLLRSCAEDFILGVCDWKTICDTRLQEVNNE